MVIPALNEETRIGATIDAAFHAGATEVIVSDGGSTDATIATAERHGARVIAGERVRARQLNRGAQASTQDVLLFLHADTILPTGACEAIRSALDSGAAFGGFLLEFIEPSSTLSVAASLINLRTHITRQPWGDHAQFVRRESFLGAGGYPDMPIMEDYELARRMRRTGRVAILPLRVRTSGRRFLQRGIIRTVATNWIIVAAYHFGVAPARLATWYRGKLPA